MAKQMRQTIRACTCCLQYEGGFPKAPLCPIVATAPLDLLYVDFTGIETMLEPNQSSRVINILVFQDHFTKYVLAYMTPDQTAKTVTKFLYGGYISIFGALASEPHHECNHSWNWVMVGKAKQNKGGEMGK